MGLAPLLDGKNRILVIKDENGVIQARSVLRLLWDGKQPVLFLERCYPVITDLKENLLEFAKERAKALNLLLLCTESEWERGPSYGKDICSLGGRAPFEYVDASGGVHYGSIWSIQNPNVIE